MSYASAVLHGFSPPLNPVIENTYSRCYMSSCRTRDTTYNLLTSKSHIWRLWCTDVRYYGKILRALDVLRRVYRSHLILVSRVRPQPNFRHKFVINKVRVIRWVSWCFKPKPKQVPLKFCDFFLLKDALRLFKVLVNRLQFWEVN